MPLIYNIYRAVAEHEDDEAQSVELRNFYQRCTLDEQQAIDQAFTYMCGWSLKSLIEADCDE